MEKEYNSRQVKIYEEYNSYSTEMLIQMVSDRKNYKAEVIRIINDIIDERNRGFYTPAQEKTEIQSDNNVGDNTVPEDEMQTEYEEVPWLNKNPVYFPGISGSSGEFINLVENEADEDKVEDEPEIDIEAEKQKYWKCPSCNELVEMEYNVCWNCQAEIPGNFQHPDKKDIIKEIADNEGKANLLVPGLVSILVGGLIYLRALAHGHTFEDSPGFFSAGIIFCGFFVLLGAGMIIFQLFTRSDKKD